MTRKATQQDFKFIYDLHIHPQVNRFLYYEVMSTEEFKLIFHSLLAQDILYVYEEEGVLKGMFKLVPKEHRASHIIVLGGVAIPHFQVRAAGCGWQMKLFYWVKKKAFSVWN